MTAADGGLRPTAEQLTAWGLDPEWSSTIDVASHDGGTHRWHLLDTAGRGGGEDADLTVLCVHGNPTWGVLWQPLLRHFVTPDPDRGRVRVIAVDQLSMGWSERTPPRTYATRVRDLADVVAALGLLDTPLVVAAHDWGGAIAMGWAIGHRHELVGGLAGMVLCNTGIAVPAGRSAPGLIRLAASAPMRDAICKRTPVFVEGAFRLSGRRVPAPLRDALRAPYRSVDRRRAIADFVADIPLTAGHPSEAALAAVADRLHELDVPVLLAWGGRDPVFDDDFAADLARRLPHTHTHRFGGAGHLVPLEADLAPVVERFVTRLRTASPLDAAADAPASAADAVAGTPAVEQLLWTEIDRAPAEQTAFVDGDATALTWGALSRRTRALAAELRRRGLRPGDRVAVLTPPGVDLPVAVYGIWRAGGVTVVADRGLGLRGLGAALRSTRPTFVVGPRAALGAAAVGRWAPHAERVDITRLPETRPDDGDAGFAPSAGSPAAVLFTSGATGPAKGVRYTHGQLGAQRDALRALYRITAADRLVAAFAPFALYGPALGITTALPAVDVTRPATLTAGDLDATCRRVDATLVFASPAALANVVTTARDASSSFDALAAVRLVLSAGAPIAAELLRSVERLTPDAELHTPYGMTEVLPVADIDLAGIAAADASDPAGGVCVGVPVPDVEVRIEPLPGSAGGFGEIVVRAPWVSEGYDQLWDAEQAARPGGGWHRTGDVGRLDDAGRLWVQGRRVHTITTADGPLGPVPIERVAERAAGVRRSAAIGIGPDGTQVVAVVLERDRPGRGSADGLAEQRLTDAVRTAVAEQIGVDVAAVLIVAALPVDIRHNAKVDRTRTAAWAAGILAGCRAGPLVGRRPSLRRGGR